MGDNRNNRRVYSRRNANRSAAGAVVIAREAVDEAEAYSALKKIKARAKRERRETNEEKRRKAITLPKLNLPE